MSEFGLSDFADKAIWSADSMDIIDVEESFGKIFKLNNLKCTVNNTKHFKKVEGKVFIGSANYYIYHYIVEDLAQYAYLKTKINDIKRFVFVKNEIGGGPKEDVLERFRYTSFGRPSIKKQDPEPHKYLDDTITMFSDQEYIPDFTKDNYIFDEVYFVFDNLRIFDKIKFNKNKRYWNGLPYFYWEINSDSIPGILQRSEGVFDYNWWHKVGLFNLALSLRPYTNDKYKFDKVFVSREDALNRYSIYRDISKQRAHSKTVEQNIKNLFIENGYKSVCLEGMDYFEQLSILKNAKQVAGTVGSGIIQSMLCSPGTVLTEIRAIKNYPITYRFMSDIFGFKLRSVNIYDYLNKQEITKEILQKEINMANILRGEI